MANSKIQLANGTVLLDLTSDTVSPEVLLQGHTAHDKAGNAIVGTASGGSPRLQSKTAAVNGTITPDSGYDGLSSVVVALPYYEWDIGSALPSGYTRLNYIESDGTQWINTNYVHKANTRVVLDCIVADTTRDGYIALFGSMNPNYGNAAFVFFSRFGNSNIPTLTRTGNEMRGSNMIYNERITVNALGVTAAWDNKSAQYAVTSTGTADAGVQPMALFAIREGSNYTRMAVMQLFGAQFYEGDRLVCNFIPCKNASNICGLYDTVGGSFFPSIGSAQFTGA